MQSQHTAGHVGRKGAEEVNGDKSVSRILGHTNITTTQIYVKITSQKLDNDLTMLGAKANTSFSNIKMA